MRRTSATVNGGPGADGNNVARGGVGDDEAEAGDCLANVEMKTLTGGGWRLGLC